MAIKNRKKRITARISALLLSAAMLCSLSACSDPVAVTKIKGTPTEAGAAESTLLHSVGDKANLQQVGKSGLIELLFDESTYSVCVADLSHDDSEKLWSALPTQENSGAATATLEIVSGDTLYKLNTQDNSVSFQNAQCSFADDALSVTYILAPDTATAHKEKYDKDDIAFKLVVNYQIKDGSVYVSAKYENLVADSDAKLTKLSLLNFFGAYSEPQQGDYIFVPDGSGALIKTDTRDDSFDSELSFPIYGGDAASGHANGGTANALIPAYGMKHSALVDESRKSFIANVSHELKTPIAIIQGYAEGLKLGINSDPEGSEEYCDIILEETGKMNRIVMELLNLEKLESGSYVPTCEKLDLSAMIKGQLAAFSMMFNDNGIKLIDRIPDGLTVHSDERTILLVLQNFLSNAVSNIGGKKIVQLTVDDNLNTYRVSVYNSGDPIDEDELDKIWYSFYKSSKKRKNEDFHFGLGLPIVKAIQKRLGRECGVVNEHGGVRFWFDVDK